MTLAIASTIAAAILPFIFGAFGKSIIKALPLLLMALFLFVACKDTMAHMPPMNMWIDLQLESFVSIASVIRELL